MSKICMILLEACRCCKEQVQISETDNGEFLLLFMGAFLFGLLCVFWGNYTD